MPVVQGGGPNGVGAEEGRAQRRRIGARRFERRRRFGACDDCLAHSWRELAACWRWRVLARDRLASNMRAGRSIERRRRCEPFDRLTCNIRCAFSTRAPAGDCSLATVCQQRACGPQPRHREPRRRARLAVRRRSFGPRRRTRRWLTPAAADGSEWGSRPRVQNFRAIITRPACRDARVGGPRMPWPAAELHR